jgi:hypothetical protein
VIETVEALYYSCIATTNRVAAMSAAIEENPYVTVLVA